MSAGGPAGPSPGGTYLSDLAHDLRTPLNGIKAWAHVLESHLDGSDPVARRAVAGILEGVAQQARIIEEMTRENSGDAPAVPEPPTPEGGFMSKRKDSQPASSGHQATAARTAKPQPNKPEQPGGKEAARARDQAIDKTDRRGER
ncbi:MAG TPA: histidine kinase dimerization/phospho-acceptor domain-containing protein [Usitatibacter sp.]|nr:histidine kinase dimerization/phospho-acceptor domain-containing protein [Usitatibacter sp.]